MLKDNGVDDDRDGQTDGNDDGCFVCNGILEGGEQCDGEADCGNNCEVIASTRAPVRPSMVDIPQAAMMSSYLP